MGTGAAIVVGEKLGSMYDIIKGNLIYICKERLIIAYEKRFWGVEINWYKN